MASIENQQSKSFWSDHIQQWQQSGLSQAAYCRQHDLCQKKFCYRKRQSRVCEDQPDKPTGFVRAQVASHISPSASDTGLSLRLRDDISIEGITERNLILVQPLLAILR